MVDRMGKLASDRAREENHADEERCSIHHHLCSHEERGEQNRDQDTSEPEARGIPRERCDGLECTGRVSTPAVLVRLGVYSLSKSLPRIRNIGKDPHDWPHLLPHRSFDALLGHCSSGILDTVRVRGILDVLSL